MRNFPNVAVVVLNYNGLSFLQRFLPNVCARSQGASIVLADNGSSDGSLAWVKAHLPQVVCLDLGKNWGFAQGYNEALKQVKSEYYVLLNSDVEVGEGWLQPLVEALEANPSLAGCQPKVRAEARPSQFEHAGAAGGFIDVLGYPFCRGRLFDAVEEDQGQYDNSSPIFWATGACMCIRSADYWLAEGLDGQFFAHMEEIDLCWRLQNLGKGWQYCPESLVYHVGGGTLPYSNPRKTHLNFRNGLAMMYKNLPASLLFPIIFTRLCLDGLAGVQFLLKGESAHCWAIVRAHFAFYGTIGYLQGWRRRFPQRNMHHPTIYKGSIVWQFFARGKKRFSDIKWS